MKTSNSHQYADYLSSTSKHKPNLKQLKNNLMSLMEDLDSGKNLGSTLDSSKVGRDSTRSSIKSGMSSPAESFGAR
jgi:hypothetical protein